MIKNKDKPHSKLSVIRFRIDTEEKDKLKEIAKNNNATLTELVLAGLRNLKIKDSKKHSEIIQTVELLTRAINHVGNNINQVTVSIHQLRITGIRESGQIEDFNKMFAVYIKLIQEFKTKLIALYE